jgi:hypothetical protein
MKPHIFRDGEGILHESCIVCGQPRTILMVDVTPVDAITLQQVLGACRGPAPAGEAR